MSFLREFATQGWTLVLPLLFLIVVVPPVYLAGHHDLARLISIVGTGLILIGNMIYIVFFHSLKRWPNLSAFDRFARLITFGR